jgi:hypothetical protein|nr:MAG TPA: head to tail adaptor [Caudoviricetes sp.]
MKFDEFIDVLTTGELSLHPIGQTDLAGNPKQMLRLVTLVNQGLRELHKRFLIRKGVVMVELNPCCYRYELEERRPYLKWMDCPPNLMEVLDVVACDGRQVRLNASHRVKPCPCSSMVEIFMPSYRTMEFSTDCGLFRVNYRRHGNLIPKPSEIDRFRMEDYELDIPDAYIDALTLYLAAKMYGVQLPREGNAVQMNPGLLYRQKYEEECQRLSSLGYEVEGMGNYQQRFSETGMP